MLWKAAKQHSSGELHFMANSLEEALKLLESDNINERFRAARFFVGNKYPQYKKLLHEKKEKERVRHIKMAFNQAISEIEKIGDNVSDAVGYDLSTEAEYKRFIKAKAIHEFSGIIIHELSKKIGLLDAALRTEFKNFPGGNSEDKLNGLRAVFEGIENIQKSADVLNPIEFDLAEFVKEVVYDEKQSAKITFNYEGEQPCIIRCDQKILYLALSNGIRNSIEAIQQLPSYSDLNNIVVCWGANDHDIWISIIDNGVGLAGNPDEAFKTGNTNKVGHIGFGLGILSQSMETLGGYAQLSSVASGGAKLILRWNKV